jgi:hypothetical protein
LSTTLLSPFFRLSLVGMRARLNMGIVGEMGSIPHFKEA